MSSIIVLKDAFKQFTLDQDKILPPEETVKNFKKKLKKVKLDILDTTARIDGGRLDIPVFMSRCGRDAIKTIGTKKQMGKGGTPEQAEASAVMELVERYSFFKFRENPENFLVDTFTNLATRSIPFDMIAKSVHDETEELEIIRPIFHNLPLRWTRAFNLTRQEEIFIPFDWFYMINEFNGSSAGNCLEEAVLQSVCEVVERNVSSLISANRMEVPLIKPDSATDPMAVEMITKYRKAGITFYLSDFSLDMGIPTVAMMAYDISTFPEKSEIIWTAGTSPHPQKALNRALSEVAQLAGDFNTGSRYVASGLPKLKTISETRFIANGKQKIPITQLPDISNLNLKVEIENCVLALKKKGLDVIVVNITEPVLNVPSIYAIIPGAHFRERAACSSVGMFSAKLISENLTPEAAIRELKKMESVLPEKYYIKFFLGRCFLSLQKPERAYEYFRQALRMDPKDQDIPSIYSYMGISLKDMNRYSEAIEVLETGTTYDEERTDIYNLLGFCYFKQKLHEKAIASFKKVLELNPGSAIDYANIASNYRELGDTEKAITYYERALSLDPGIHFALENLLKLKQ